MIWSPPYSIGNERKKAFLLSFFRPKSYRLAICLSSNSKNETNNHNQQPTSPIVAHYQLPITMEKILIADPEQQQQQNPLFRMD